MGIETAIIAALAAAGASTAVAATLAAFIVNTVISFGLGLIGSALAPKAKTPNLSGAFSAKAAGITQNIKQAVTVRRMLYGEARVGGALTFLETTNDDQDLHVILTIADHECEEVGEIWFNDVSIPPDHIDANGEVIDGPFAGHARINIHLGDGAQSADSDIVSETERTANFIGDGVTYLYVTLYYDRDVFPTSLPAITAHVKGKKIIDPRDDVKRWTANGSLFVRDYLIEPLSSLTPGAGVSVENIDDDYLISSINVCEEIVSTATLSRPVSNVEPSLNVLTLTANDDGALIYQTGDRVRVSSTDDLPGGLGSVINLFNESEQLINANGWSDVRNDATENQDTAPDGSNTATRVTDQAGSSGGHYLIEQVDNVDLNNSLTFSVYVKPNDFQRFQMRVRDKDATANYTYAIFDLTTQTVTGSLERGESVLHGATIESVGDGWFRLSVSATVRTTDTNTSLQVFLYSYEPGSTGNSLGYIGDVNDTWFVWGAMLQTGDTLTDYVESNGSQGSQIIDYYIIPYQRKTLFRVKLAASLEDALAGVAVDITSEGSGNITISKTGEPRYFGGGIIETNETVGDNLNDILTTIGGDLTYVGGMWKIKAAAYFTPAYSFDENHIISETMNVVTATTQRSSFNLVKGVYVSPLNLGEAADYPSVTNAQYVADDNGEILPVDYDLPMTQRPHTAQRLAKIKLERHRQELLVEAEFSLHVLQVQPTDVISFSVDHLGWSNKPFEVVTWQLDNRAQSGSSLFFVKMSMQETASGVYDWNNGEETLVDPAPNTNLPNPLEVDPPTGLAVVPIEVRTANGDLTYEFVVSWLAPNDIFVVNGGYYDIQFKKTNDDDWRRSFRGEDEDTEIRVSQVEPAVNYDVRVRSVNRIGVRSSYQSLFGFTVDSPSGATLRLDDGFITGVVVESENMNLITDVVGSDIDEGDIS